MIPRGRRRSFTFWNQRDPRELVSSKQTDGETQDPSRLLTVTGLPDVCHECRRACHHWFHFRGRGCNFNGGYIFVRMMLQFAFREDHW